MMNRTLLAVRGSRFAARCSRLEARCSTRAARGALFAGLWILFVARFAATAAAQVAVPSRGLTAVEGLKVGHHTLATRPTGCTVVVAEKGATAGVDIRGSAPGTRETDLLDPTATVDRVHAIVLAGGSAFGLDTATGVVRYLEQRGVGLTFGGAVIPIVPAAILFDLGVGDGRIRPDAECGVAAASAASDGPVAEGNVGAGAGATVGKMRGRDLAMKGGIGSSAITLPDGLVVAALVAVNARGDIVDPGTGRIVAGMRTADGTGLADVRKQLRSTGLEPLAPEPLQHTTLGIVATNAALTKAQATKMAQMAHDGFARAIVPAHTTADGDAIFALATGTRAGAANVDTIGALAAEAVADAIVRAVRAATGIPGFPAARDLR
jgi:L-aminopeptidase/D-esterase-like protein